MINYNLWNKILDSMPEDWTHQDLPIYLGKINKIDIWIVDGEKVRDKYFMDFCYGGHDLVYGQGNTTYPEVGFIPPRQIWLDGHIDSDDLSFTLYHELIERNLMSVRKLSYEQAHQVANRAERQLELQVRS